MAGPDPGSQAIQVPDLLQRGAQSGACTRGFQELGDSGLTPPDPFRVQQGPEKPRPQEARAHGSGGGIQHRQEGHVSVVGTQRLDQLQVAAGHRIEGHDRFGTVDPGRTQVFPRPGADLFRVGDQRARGPDQQLVPWLQPESVERQHLVAPLQLVAGGLHLEHPVRPDCAHHSATPLGEAVVRLGHEEFAGLQPLKLVFDLGRAGLHEHQLARRYIHGGQADGRIPADERDHEVVAPRFEERFRDHGARSESLDDLPAHDPLGFGRILDLVANRDRLPELHQPSHVLGDGLGRDPGQRDAARSAVVAGREGQAQEPGAFLGVLAEQLVEVAYAEEDEVVPAAGFRLPPLPHERCVEAAVLGRSQGRCRCSLRRGTGTARQSVVDLRVATESGEAPECLRYRRRDRRSTGAGRLEASQPVRVGDHRHGTEGHGRPGDHRR